MGLKGNKMIGQTEIKAGGDVFHDLIKLKPHHISTISPEKVQDFTLHEGELGTVGSVVSWNYFHDGKASYGKNIIQEVNEEKQSIVFKLIEGDLLELYKSFTWTYHVDTMGSDSLVTWTLEYEKLAVDTPHPGTLLNYLLHLVEDIENHHQNK